MSNNIRAQFQRLETLKDEAESPDTKRLIEALILQTGILNDRLAVIEQNLAPSARGANAIGPR